MLTSFILDFYLKYKFSNILTELQSNNIAAWKKWSGGQQKKMKIDPIRLERLKGLGYLQ
jgi:hypothetical protein